MSYFGDGRSELREVIPWSKVKDEWDAEWFLDANEKIQAGYETGGAPTHFSPRLHNHAPIIFYRRFTAVLNSGWDHTGTEDDYVSVDECSPLKELNPRKGADGKLYVTTHLTLL